MQRRGKVQVPWLAAFGGFIAVSSALLISVAPRSHAADSVTIKIDEAVQILRQTETELRETQRDDADIRSSLEMLGSKVRNMSEVAVIIAARIHNFEERITTLEAQLEQLDASREEKQDGLRARQQALIYSIAALQRLRKMPPSALLLMPVSVSETMRTSALLSWVTDHYEREAVTLRVELREAEEIELAAKQRREELSQALASLQIERTALDDLADRTREKKVSALAAQRQTGERLRGLADKALSLNELIRDLEKENVEQRRQAAARQRENRLLLARLAAREAVAADVRGRPPAPLESTGASEDDKSDQTVIASAPMNGASTKRQGPSRVSAYVATPAETPKAALSAPPRSIASAHGQFLFPARGQLVSHFGQTTAPGVSSRGIIIETRPSARVVAPFEGTVAFAGPFRDYGQLLIIAHGEGYHTLLSGLSRIDAIVGQQVLAGEPVGVMASAGGTNPQLYVEIRREGRPINPLVWLAAGDSKVSG